MSALAIQFQVSKAGAVLQEVTLNQDVIKIGRMATSHLQVDDELVSRMHAVIEVGGPGQVFIFDLGSAAGTMVNGKKVNKAPLNSGDVITLGGIDVKVTFLSAEDQAAAAPVQTAMPSVPPPMAPQGFGGASSMMGMGMMGMGAARPQMASTGAAPAPRRKVITRPAVNIDPASLEDPSRYATEVVTVWQDTVLRVDLFKTGEKKVKTFYVGEDLSCDFPIQPSFLGGQSKVSLVACNPGGGAMVSIPPKPQGDVTFEDGRSASLAELIGAGQLHQGGEIPGGYSFSLPQRARIRVDLGDFTFLVSSIPEPRKLLAPIKFDWTTQIFTGASFLLHTLLVSLAFFDVPDLLGMSLDFLDDANRGVKYAPLELEKKQLEEDKKKDDEGGQGKKHKDEEGQMGKRDSAKTDNRYAIKGPQDNKDLRMAREMAKEAGILQYLTAANVPVSPFGSDQPLGIDPENALGALLGNQIGDNFGYGGLGVNGTGRGGGGTGEGTIGLGALGTIGHGAGGGTGSGYGRGAGGLGGRRGKVPQIRSGAAMVKGSLSKEVIRRIVHRHINEVKFCYERELAARPDLAGRVSIKFIIMGTGAVQMAAVAESTIGNPNVENCIAQAVRRWTFPQPEGGGIVIVTYPFQLEAPEG
jgi:pSer/pThr/pTyr-binding forkhead associated (FHA) protein